MKFKYAILYVENVEKTLEFYQQAFGFKTAFLHESVDYGELDTGCTTISFSSFAYWFHPHMWFESLKRSRQGQFWRNHYS